MSSPIKTRSWVQKDGVLVEVKTLPPADKERLARELSVRYMNTMFAGVAEFRPAEKEGT